MIKCLNCRTKKDYIEFEKMRISRNGISLFCSTCMSKLRRKPNFWVDYAKLQNSLAVTLGPLYSEATEYKIYPKCKPPLPYIKTIPYKVKPLRKIRIKRISKKKTPKIIQYNSKGFEIACFNNVFEAATVTGFASNDIAKVLDTENTLNEFKFVLF